MTFDPMPFTLQSPPTNLHPPTSTRHPPPATHAPPPTPALLRCCGRVPTFASSCWASAPARPTSSTCAAPTTTRPSRWIHTAWSPRP
eukprot:scaffold26465_cov59-Phaeocystis_antarctica.AAC.11